jgi:Ni2+-binding GTPase involved in maturation of urease and hydrogenase
MCPHWGKKQIGGNIKMELQKNTPASSSALQVVTVAGPPSSGKTSVLLHVITALNAQGVKAGVAKFDCLSADDQERYASKGVPVLTGLSAYQCPDHYFVSNVPNVMAWAHAQKLDLLLTESAGLCNRCSPYLKEVPAVCVIDHLSGLQAPKKIGPMLRLADCIVLTRGDMVSQAEREVFSLQISMRNPRAQVMEINGRTGQGVLPLLTFLSHAPRHGSLDECTLRFPMPSALCSYCLGEKKVGEEYQMGNRRMLNWKDEVQ